MEDLKIQVSCFIYLFMSIIDKIKIKNFISRLVDSSCRVSRLEYMKVRVLLEKRMNTLEYDKIIEQLTQYLYNIQDAYIKNQLTTSLNDVFLWNGELYIITTRVGVWKDLGPLLSKELKKNINICDDLYGTQFLLKKHYTFNKTWNR